MQMKDVDTTRVLAFRDGMYGTAVPVRVLSHEAYQGNGGGGFVKVEQRTRKSYRGRVRIGGYLAVFRKWGANDEEALKALETITLEEVVAGSIPDVLQVKLINDARWVRSETWAENRERNVRLKQENERATAQKAAMENTGMLAAESLRGALEEAGFTMGETMKVTSNAHYVTLTVSHVEAVRLTRVLRKFRKELGEA